MSVSRWVGKRDVFSSDCCPAAVVFVFKPVVGTVVCKYELLTLLLFVWDNKKNGCDGVELVGVSAKCVLLADLDLVRFGSC